MKSLSKTQEDDPRFTRAFWKTIGVILLAAMGLAIGLVCMGLIAFYGQKYNF